MNIFLLYSYTETLHMPNRNFMLLELNVNIFIFEDLMRDLLSFYLFIYLFIYFT